MCKVMDHNFAHLLHHNLWCINFVQFFLEHPVEHSLDFMIKFYICCTLICIISQYLYLYCIKMCTLSSFYVSFRLLVLLKAYLHCSKNVISLLIRSRRVVPYECSFIHCMVYAALRSISFFPTAFYNVSQ